MKWHDLLGIPWQLHGRTAKGGMDCSTLAEEVMRRAGMSPPPTNPYRCPGSAGEAEEMPLYLADMGEHFDRVGSTAGDARQCGDVVLAADSSGIARCLFVLVEPARGTFLTAAHDTGVVAVRRFVMDNIIAVYRLKNGNG